MRKTLLFLVFLPLWLTSQTLPQPALWFKSAENTFVGKDTANASVLLDWNGDLSLLSADTINGYPALKVAGDSTNGHFVLSTDVFKDRQNALILIAYQPYKKPFVQYSSKNLPEYGLWTLFKQDTTHLTSIRYGDGKSRFRYQYQDFPGIIVTSNLVSFKTLNNNTLTDSTVIEIPNDTLFLGYADSLFFKGKLAEYIIINQPITENSRQVWQSYLALKYGGTLVKGNYLNAAGDTLWYYAKNQDFTDGVGGIGRDDTLFLKQNFSKIAGDSLLISLQNVDIQIQSNQTQFKNGEYIFWGHNSGLCEISNVIFPVNDDNYKLFSRFWKIRPFTKSTYPLDFQINIPENNNPQNLKLFVSPTPNFYSFETSVFAPQNSDNQKVKFTNLTFNDSITYFTFGYNVNDLNETGINNGNSNQNSDQNSNNQTLTGAAAVFTEADWQPNPVRENLYISYKLTRNATVWFSVHSNGSIPLCQTPPQNMQAGNNQTIIQMSHLPTGTYTVYVHVDDMVIMQTIIKK